MKLYFLTKISFLQEDESGNIKTVSQQYLIDAMSNTEAEARMIQYLPNNHPEIGIPALTKQKVEVIFAENGSETWWKVKAMFLEFNEKTQKDKKTPYNYVVNAETVEEAIKLTKQLLGTLNDYAIEKVELTKIVEVLERESGITSNFQTV
jgi:Domain of unknown function (DUF4494)